MIPITFRPRLAWRALWLFALPNAAILILNALTEARMLIPVLGAINASLALGVSVAFIPAMIRIFSVDAPLEKGDWLAFGIFISWSSLALRFIYSLVWRWEGMPLWMLNTDPVAYLTFMTMFGAMSHLVAPGAIGDRVPTRRWIMIGALAAGGVLCMLTIGYLLRTQVVMDVGHWVG